MSRVPRSREEIEAARLLAGDSFFAQALSRSYEGRSRADYDAEPVPREQAEAAIEDAERFVEAVEGWLARGDG